MIVRKEHRRVLPKLRRQAFHSCVTALTAPLTLDQAMEWLDDDGPYVQVWRGVHRALKPGAFCVALTDVADYDLAALALRLVGFEVRDCLRVMHASGWSPAVLFRKPPDSTLARNALAHGVGGINIDGCRVPTSDDLNGGAYSENATCRTQMWGVEADNSWRRGGAGTYVQPAGRFPANLVHDGSEPVVAEFPQSKGQQGDVRGTEQSRPGMEGTHCYGEYGRVPSPKRGDTGSAARFFWSYGSKLDLWRYLARLVTPGNGLVLDPYARPIRAKAASLEGLRYFGIDGRQE